MKVDLQEHQILVSIISLGKNGLFTESENDHKELYERG